MNPKSLETAKRQLLAEGTPEAWQAAALLKSWAREWNTTEAEAIEIFVECAKAGELNEGWNAGLRQAFAELPASDLWRLVKARSDLLQLFDAIGFEWPPQADTQKPHLEGCGSQELTD